MAVSFFSQSEYNQQQKHMLQSLARAEMRRQDIRKKLQETDSELMELLRRFAVSQQSILH